MTATYRKHLTKYHYLIYDATVKVEKLKQSKAPIKSENNTTTGPRAPFELNVFKDLLVRWIVVDDQVR